MPNQKLKQNSKSAFTLVEVMTAVTVLSIIAIGSLNFQYYAARDSKISRTQITATRTAQLLLEDWMSTGGSEDYDPSQLGLGFTAINDTPSDLNKYSDLGNRLHEDLYVIEVDDIKMLVMLMSKEIAYDEAAKVKLRQLCVYVSIGVVFDKNNTVEKAESDNVKPIILTTYVRVDASGG